MTGTLISLISILTGIMASNLLGYFKNKYSFGFTGNTLIGVFGSVLFIKSFGRLGFDPWSIMNAGDFDGFLLTLNILVSALGGVIGLIAMKLITSKLKKHQ